MALKIIKDKDGSFRRIWYGRLTRNGRKVDVRLKVGPIRGKIPVTPSGQWDREAKGDPAFERSREAAEEAFRDLVYGDGKKRRSLERLENERRALTGQGFGRTSLSSLYRRWLGIARQKEPTEIRKGIAKTTFSGFAAFADTFARKRGGVCSSLEDVTPEMAAAYFEKLKMQYAWETVKGRFSIMRNAWQRFARANGEANPFAGVILRGGSEDSRGRIPRVPLTLVELKRLFDIVREKRPAIFPLVACVATTGLRLGDAVSLRWADVDLGKGTIGGRDGLETSKTGAKVPLRILEPFASVLREMDAKRDERDVYLFPDQRERYGVGSLRSGLIREIKPFIALAVSDEEESEVEEVQTPKTLEETLALVDAAGFKPGKAKRVREVAKQFYSGIIAETIAKNLNKSPAQVSADLETLEDLTGDKLRAARLRKRVELGKSRRSLVNITRQKAKGRKAASIYGWHSLRATFVVLAINAGVPLAYVRKVVGHTTTKMTLEYFNPLKDHAADVVAKKLGSAFAEMLAADGETIDEEAEALPAPSLDSQIAALSEDEKKALVKKLLGI